MKTHRLRGLASEYAFAAQYYSLVVDEKDSLIQPTLDTGWDFMVASTGVRIQVKRFTQKTNQNKWNLDLRRKRNKGTGNYDGTEFDFLAIHDWEYKLNESNDFIITHVSNLIKDGKMKQSVGIKSLPNQGFESLL